VKVYLASVGCRLNQSEIETLGRRLLAAGHVLVPDPGQADQAVVNTCAVTRQAAKDGRALVRRIRRSNPQALISVTGCHATLAPGELAALSGAVRIVPNRDKERLLQILDPAAEASPPPYDQEPILREFLAGSQANTRAFVKVQDGCDNRCTFCVTTLARGPGRSRALADIIDEIQALAAAGYREAVLTGVHLGSYGRDLGRRHGLAELVRAILHHSDIARLRLSSLEPWDIPPGFFELWQDRRLLPHLHVPLQSGSDRILRRMARRTTCDTFRRLAVQARSLIPGLNLTTDLIVGFPGESEDDHSRSLAFVEEMAFGRLHVFPYSRRPGTAAAEMPGQLPGQVKKQRVRQMIDLGRRLSRAYHAQFEGHLTQVLWEYVVAANGEGLRWTGYTPNYIRVTAAGPAELCNRETATLLEDARPEGMSGVVVTEPGTAWLGPGY
jgi:threonylcarbamoyladenosine tRNA methylthiotransferase MtaB